MRWASACVLAATAALATAPAALADHSELLARWHLDTASGGYTPDDSGHGLNGEVNGGATFVTGGRFANALDLGGPGSSEAEIPDDPILEPARMTVLAWVRASAPGSYRYIVAKGGKSCSGSSYALQSGDYGGLVFYIYDGTSFAVSPDAGAGVWDDQWHAVAGTFDGSTVRLWVDGAEIGSGTPTSVTPSHALDTGVLRIGNYPLSNLCAGGGGSTVFPGLIDEARIYNRALAADEIAHLHSAAHASPPDLPPPPANTAPPSISGASAEPRPGDELVADPGSWTHGPSGFQYQWLSCDENGAACVDIGGATTPGYRLTEYDLGHAVRVRVRASNGSGTSAPADSAATAVVRAPPGVEQPPEVEQPAPLPSIDDTAVRRLDSKVRGTRRGSRVLVDTGRQVMCAAEGPRCALSVSWTATSKGRGRSRPQRITGRVSRTIAANVAELVRFPLSSRAARVLRNEPLSLSVRVALRETCPARRRAIQSSQCGSTRITRVTASLPPKLPFPTPSGCSAQGKQPFYRQGPATPKRVALTFDDGPERNSAKFLDLLRAKKVHATFFPVGRSDFSGRPELLRRALREGHVIGNHTVNHPSVDRADAAATAEIDKETALIRAATGFTPCLFRPPNGASSPALEALITSRAMTTISADVDPSDWQTNIAAETIRSHVIANTKPGSIVIMHEDYSSDSTLAALGPIIDELRRQGYAFVTVPELLGMPLRYP